MQASGPTEWLSQGRGYIQPALQWLSKLEGWSYCSVFQPAVKYSKCYKVRMVLAQVIQVQGHILIHEST